MALTIQRTSLFKGRILTTSLMALALILQPFYMLAASQAVNAVAPNFEALAIEPCVAPASRHFTSLNGWDLSQSSKDGSASSLVTSAGLRVKTEANGQRKAAGYYPVDFALSNLGANTNDILDITVNSGSIQPGGQLVIDFDGDGTNDGILVGEPNYYGNNWWLNKAASGDVKNKAPHTGGGSGSQWYGDANEWLNAFPSARVKAIGYSLGGSVTGDYTITKITAGCVDYTFGPEAPTVAIATPAQNSHVRTNAPNALRVAGTFTDDKAVNYLQLELVHAGNLVTVYTMHYNNPGLNADGNFSIDMPVPANLPTGEYSLFYTGTDFDGGATSRLERKFIIDNTAPIFSVTNITEGMTVGPNADGKLVVMGNFSDAHSGANYIQTQLVYKGSDKGVVTKYGVIDNGILAEYDVAELNNGSEYYIAVSAADVAGNFSERKIINFTLDKTLPAISVSSSQGNISSRVFREVSFKLHDSGKIDRAELNGKLFTSNRGSVWGDLNNVWTNRGWSGAIEGENTLVLFDIAGNQTSFTFTIDRTAPTATFTYSNSNGNALTNEHVLVTMESSEPIQTPSDWTWVDDTHFTRSYSSNGKREVVVTDIAGNVSTAQKFEIKRIDRGAPTITGVANDAIVNGPIELTIVDPKYEGYDGFDKLSGLTVNGAKVSTEAGPNKTYLYTVSDEGEYTVIATDKAGNSTTITFTIDNTAPVVGISGVVEGGEYDTPVTVLGAITDDNLKNYYLTVIKDGVLVNIPDVARNGSASSVEFTLSEVGSYVVKLEARDKAGNKDGTSTIDGDSVKTVSFTIVAPSVDDDEVGEEDDDTTGGNVSTGDNTNAPTGGTENEGETPRTAPAQLFTTPAFFGFGTPSFDNEDATQDESANTGDNANGDILGEQDQEESAPLKDTGEVLGIMDHKLFGIAWYWYLVILAAIVGAWLMLAASIRRNREEV